MVFAVLLGLFACLCFCLFVFYFFSFGSVLCVLTIVLSQLPPHSISPLFLFRLIKYFNVSPCSFHNLSVLQLSCWGRVLCHVHVCVLYVCACVYACACMPVCIIYVCVCMCACVHVYACVMCVYVCVHMCMCVWRGVPLSLFPYLFPYLLAAADPILW